MKNTLAMVQAIAGQTLRGVTETDAVEAFRSRLNALGKAHDQLLSQDWATTDLEQIIRLLFKIHAEETRFDIAGPTVKLGESDSFDLPATARARHQRHEAWLALRPQGRVLLTWRIDNGGADPEMVMTWRESGGPTVAEPTRRSTSPWEKVHRQRKRPR